MVLSPIETHGVELGLNKTAEAIAEADTGGHAQTHSVLIEWLVLLITSVSTKVKKNKRGSMIHYLIACVAPT